MTDKLAQALFVSNKIKELRDNLGWNQSRLANEAGVTAAALSKIEKGDGRLPSLVVLRKLASALKVDPSEITGEETSRAAGTDERNREFYRRWDVLDNLSTEDQEILKGMAERLKKITDD